MAEFWQLTIDGLTTGLIYAALALALVLIYTSTHVVNFAQGELAMFSTYLTVTVASLGVALPLAVLISIICSFVFGVIIERALIRRVEQAEHITLVVTLVGLLLTINALAGLIWSYQVRSVPSMFPAGAWQIGVARVPLDSVGVLLVLGIVLLLLYGLFRGTKLGLLLRGVASNPQSCTLIGVDVGRYLALGWGLAAAIGALAGALITPHLFLDPNVMDSVLVYALAAATLGGFGSALGAVLGGLLIGVADSWAGGYLIGSDLKILVPLCIVIVLLLMRPQGLFGSRVVTRV